jgi:hypothetical protein
MPVFHGIVHLPKKATSLSIDYNNGTITKAKMTVTYSGGPIGTYLSADGGTTWEEVTSGVLHYFTVTGTDLRWRITAREGTATVTNVEIKQYH